MRNTPYVYIIGVLALVFWGTIIYMTYDRWDFCKKSPKIVVSSPQELLSGEEDSAPSESFISDDFEIVWGEKSAAFPFDGMINFEIKTDLVNCPEISPLKAWIKGKYEIGRSSTLSTDFHNLDVSRGLDVDYMVQRRIAEKVRDVLKRLPKKVYSSGGNDIIDAVNKNLADSHIKLVNPYWEFTYRKLRLYN